MDAAHFDRLTRSLTSASSRRGILAGLAASLGLAAIHIPGSVQAKKKKRKNKKKAKRNAFGCVNVGNFCKNASQCCSGICKGKKGKKTCKAHDQSTCQAGQNITSCGGAVDVACTTSAGGPGRCHSTTGNAGYCASSTRCFQCKQDVDCEGVCGPHAACIPCEQECAVLGGTLCIAAIEDACDFV